MDSLDISVLTTCVAVIDAGGFNEAARVLGISQPAVSQQIARLEGNLGKNIFVRFENRRQPHLTSFGRDFVDEARKLLKVHHEVLGRITKHQNSVTLGISAMSADFLSDRVLEKISQLLGQRPRIRIEEYSSTLHELTNSGDIDLALALNFDKFDHEENVGQLEYRWFSASTHAIESVPLEIITYGDDRCRIHQIGIADLKAHGFEPRLAFHASSLEVACASARMGAGLIFLNSKSLRPGLTTREEIPAICAVGIKLVGRAGFALDLPKWRKELHADA